MTSRNFQDLSEAQKQTAKAVRSLLLQLRETVVAQKPNKDRQTVSARSPFQTASRARFSSPAADLARVLRPLIERSRRDSAVVLGANELAQTRRPPTTRTGALFQSDRGATEDLGRVITAATRTARNFGQLLSQNTRALLQNRRAIGTGQSLLTGLFSSAGRGGGSSGLLGSGLGLVPLGLRIAGLFRRRQAEPRSFTPFELPPSLSLEVANTDNILTGFPRVARKQAGEVKIIRQEVPAAQPQVTVNVNAMDTQSFLDRSEDIAGALREAMLHMHPINDVIGEM